ncbi:MAG: HNH endonuclease, partial [Pseudomonas sp.]
LMADLCLSKTADTKLKVTEGSDDSFAQDEVPTPAPELKKIEQQLDLDLKVREDANPSKPSRYISSAVRMTVWMRDGGCCGFTDAKTGLRCGSRHQLELDHVKPFALGGDNSVENMRLRCRTHNQWTAAQTYGAASTKFRRAIVRENVVAYAS